MSEPPGNEGPPPLPTTTSGSYQTGPMAAVQSTRAALKRFARLWGFGLFILLCAWWFRDVLLPFVFAVGVAYVLAPVVSWLSVRKNGKRRMPRGAAVLLCYVVVVGVLVLFFVAFLPSLSGDFARLGKEAPKLWDKVETRWTPQVARWLERRFPSLAPAREPPPPPPDGPTLELPPPPGTVLTVTPMATGDFAITVPEKGIILERIDARRVRVLPPEEKKDKRLEDVLKDKLDGVATGMTSEFSDVIRAGAKFVTGTVKLIMQLVLVLMVAAFILVDVERIHGFARGLVPERYRPDYDTVTAGIDRGLHGVIRGQLIICLINGVLTYVGLLVFGVKYSLLLAAVAAIMSLIPIFGSILSSIPIVIVAMVSSSEGVDILRGAFMLAWILGIHFIEANFLNPRIIGSAAKIHPVLVIFALIAGERTYGLVGALLAVPVLSIIQTLFLFFRRRAWRERGT